MLEEEQFSTFADRVHALMGDAILRARCSTISGRVRCRRRHEARTHGMRFSLARREIEASWGVTNLEVPLSEVCQTDGFYWFVSHLLAELPRYRPDPQRRSQRVSRDSWDPQQEPSGGGARTGRRMARGAVLDLASAKSTAPRLSGPPATRCYGPTHRRRGRGVDRAAAGAAARGVLCRRAAPRAACAVRSGCARGP